MSDVTDSIGLLAVTGPRARDLLQTLTGTDLSNESFRWLTAREIDVAGVPCKAWGAELTTELTPIQARLDRFDDYSTEFIGRGATIALRDQDEPLDMVLVYVDADDVDCRGNEPVYSGGEMVGTTTSGAYGHTVAKSLASAYVSPAFERPGNSLEIEILGSRRTATVLAEAAYDPSNSALRA